MYMLCKLWKNATSGFCKVCVFFAGAAKHNGRTWRQSFYLRAKVSCYALSVYTNYVEVHFDPRYLLVICVILHERVNIVYG